MNWCSMNKVNILLTPGGGPGLLAFLASLRSSEKYAARIVMADMIPECGNLFLPDVDACYTLPACNSLEYLPALLRLIHKEKIGYFYSGLDEEMPVLARHRDEIERAGCKMLLPPVQTLETALDKLAMHRALEGKVALPRTFVVDDALERDAVWNELGPDVLFKVASSRGGRHIYLPENREDFDFYWSKVQRLSVENGLTFLLQERIRGQEFNVSSLHTPQGKLVYAVSRRKFESRDVKSTTTAAGIEKRDDVIEQALTAVAAIGTNCGFNNVETIVSERDDKPYLIEINGGRTAAQDMNLVAAGIPLTDLLLDILRGEDVSELPHPPDGTCILKIRKDVVVDMGQIKGVQEA